jgi:hypothetical protein
MSKARNLREAGFEVSASLPTGSGFFRDLEVGPAPLSGPKLTAAKMAEALRQMGSPEMRARTAVLGKAIRCEPNGCRRR